jgi:antitoxin component of RelBE/YafQ-DinJ toxin-antitoxin module
VLAAMGLTVSDAFHHDDPRRPRGRRCRSSRLNANATTIEAMKRAGVAWSFATVEDLMADLNADD